MSGPALPFGARQLPGVLEELRRQAEKLPASWTGRKMVSALRRLCLMGRQDPIDVEVFPGQNARLYPRGNLCEKRAFTGPQFWDGPERAALAKMIAAQPAGQPFHFIDAGANVGLYTLFVRSAAAQAQRPIRALAIEPDAVNQARLQFNLQASGADDVTVSPAALGAERGTVRLTVADRNRGEVQVASAETVGDTGRDIPLAAASGYLDRGSLGKSRRPED